jgi:hypothetical protein
MTYPIKLALFILSLGASAVQATSLDFSHDNYIVVKDIDIVAAPFGGNLLDSMSSTVSSGEFSGMTLRSEVYSNAVGGADYYYQLSGGQASSVRYMVVNPEVLAGTNLDVSQTASAFGGFETGGSASSAVAASIFPKNGFWGANVTYVLNTFPGSASFTQILRTSYGNFGHSEVYLAGSTGEFSGSAMSFAPAIPEPEEYALMLAGLGLVGAVVRRRKAKQGTPASSPFREGALA